MTVGGNRGEKAFPVLVSQRFSSPSKSVRRRRIRRNVPSFWFLAPALGMYAFVVLYPTISTIYYSFTNWSILGSKAKLIGLRNYAAVLKNPETNAAILHTLELAGVLTVGVNVIGLAVALVLRRRNRLTYMLRLVWFLPAVLPTIAVAFLWTFIYSPLGPIAEIWTDLFHSSGPGFLGSSQGALWSIAAIVIWQGSGYAMVIYSAGLETIPQSLFEAAEVDGAGPLARIRFVVLPQLWAPAIVSTALALIPGLQIFTRVLATTGGGPGYSTVTLSLLVYDEAFAFNRFGYGMALAVVLLIGVAVIGGAQIGITSWRAARGTNG